MARPSAMAAASNADFCVAPESTAFLISPFRIASSASVHAIRLRFDLPLSSALADGAAGAAAAAAPSPAAGAAAAGAARSTVAALIRAAIAAGSVEAAAAAAAPSCCTEAASASASATPGWCRSAITGRAGGARARPVVRTPVGSPRRKVPSQ